MMIDELITGKNISLAGGVFVVISASRKPLQPFWDTPFGQRLLPLSPLILGVAGALIGMADAESWQDRLVIGLIAGYASAHTFKVGKTTLLGYGLTDEDTEVPTVQPKPSGPTPSPAPAPSNPQYPSWPSAPPPGSASVPSELPPTPLPAPSTPAPVPSVPISITEVVPAAQVPEVPLPPPGDAEKKE